MDWQLESGSALAWRQLPSPVQLAARVASLAAAARLKVEQRTAPDRTGEED